MGTEIFVCGIEFEIVDLLYVGRVHGDGGMGQTIQLVCKTSSKLVSTSTKKCLI